MRRLVELGRTAPVRQRRQGDRIGKSGMTRVIAWPGIAPRPPPTQIERGIRSLGRGDGRTGHGSGRCGGRDARGNRCRWCRLWSERGQPFVRVDGNDARRKRAGCQAMRHATLHQRRLWKTGGWQLVTDGRAALQHRTRLFGRARTARVAACQAFVRSDARNGSGARVSGRRARRHRRWPAHAAWTRWPATRSTTPSPHARGG